MTPEPTKAARELLAFYLEAGVDALVDEVPVNRFADEPPAAEPATARAAEPQHGRRPLPSLPPKGAAAAPPKPAAPSSPEDAAMSARELARGARTLEELREAMEKFEGCPLKATAKQLVFADGTPGSRVMFVGEAPGRDEDIEGLPFVGRSGKLLDQMIKAIGLDRSKVYIANVVPWRPPGNRTPTPQETQICLPFIARQIELAAPDILVCLGGPAMQTLLGFKEGIMKARGRWTTYRAGDRDIRAIATLHPAYLLRSPIAKRLAWRDFLAIKKALG